MEQEKDLFMEQGKNLSVNRFPVPLDSGILYTVLAVYYVYISKHIENIASQFQLNNWIILAFSQIVFLALPPLIFALFRKYPIKETFRLKAPRPLEVLLMLLISPAMVVAGFCSGFLALLGVKAIFGRVELFSPVVEFMSGNLIFMIILIAVLPAICEEFLFRGMIQRGLERLGAGWSIFLSGLLFGLFHFDFQRLAAQTLIGWIAAYAVYRTGSLFNGMILHFMNNGILALFTYFTAKAVEEIEARAVTDPFASPEFANIGSELNISQGKFLFLVAVVLVIILIASLLVVLGLLVLLRSVTRDTVEVPVKMPGSAKGLLAAVPGIVLIMIVYLALGYNLLGNDFGRQLLIMIGAG
jgi:membrane protease YdiL (CAAX protease family)